MNNLMILINGVACFIVSYVTLGMLVQMRSPESWKGWFERVAMAATVGTAVFAGLAPAAIGYTPFPWTIAFNCALGLWLGIMFQRTVGWKKHLLENVNSARKFFENFPDRINDAKLCWNDRVDRIRGE